MRRILVLMFCLFIIIFAASCAHRTTYTNFNERLKSYSFERYNATIDDISLVLGSPPTRCDPVENTPLTSGIKYDEQQEVPVVIAVLPNGPAHKAGILPGDVIKAVNGQPISNLKQFDTLNATLGEVQDIQYTTTRDVVTVTRTKLKVEQCYWDIQAGGVAQSGSLAYANRYAGSASSWGGAYQRFYRASCRIVAGYVFGCTTNWQE